MATTTIKGGDIHHQKTVTLHHIGSLAHLKGDGNLYAYAVTTENSQDLILYQAQGNASMDFLIEGENGGGSSRESIANLLDEGLGTSLDGTDEISSSIHSTLGRNDSGVFSSDETASPNGIQQQKTLDPQKKHRAKNSSPNRQGPQRCAICGKIFSNASALTKHKLTHSDERKHACSMCGKAFKRQDHLNGHMLTHRNKKPFECTAKGCGKSYCDARSLRRHIESRHGHDVLVTLPPQQSSESGVVVKTEIQLKTELEPEDLKMGMDLEIKLEPLEGDLMKKPGVTSSQLHHLLTKRAGRDSSPPLINPGSVRIQGSYPSNWATNENEMTNGIEKKESSGKCPSSPLSSPVSPSPALLKEQLELIHQIIQQAQEESNSATAKAVKTGKKKSSAGLLLPKNESGEECNRGGEEKPVECTICCRRFKNTPALNGHMRLHGGYFKKDGDGKKKEPGSKDALSTPLQTASVSVRALIEEKIIQKRNTINTSQGGIVREGQGSVNQVSSTTEAQSGFLETEAAEGLESDRAAGNPMGSGLSSTFSGSQPNHASAEAQDFQFVYGEDNTDYLLMEEEVFNKVSSICPDSFLNGIDESILNGTTASGNDHLPPDWTWGPSSSLDAVSSRLSNLFNANSGPDPFKSTGSGNSFTPLPPLDPVFYTSPTPQSPSLHSQDSPSFIYPTPPASLESHQALQSPLFPFPSAPPAVVFPFESSQQNLGLDGRTTIIPGEGTTTLFPSPLLGCLKGGIPEGGNSINSSSITGRQFVKARNHSGGSSSELNILTPSSSPSLTAPSEDSLQSMKELKVNGPSRMDCSVEEDIFLNPNSVPGSPCIKVTKRKQFRNTFASNLRPQTHSSHSAHFTPYPILSPVRSAPGLFWTFSTKLSHVDDTKRELPRINVGSNFQVNLPACKMIEPKCSNIIQDEPLKEDLMWDPKVMGVCSAEEVDKYLEFACCSAIPGGGRNKEYALHLLSLCRGDINAALIFMMKPNPLLPDYLKKYKYPEKEKWCREEITAFQEALLRHGKDFIQVGREIGTKSSEECVIFYQLWKKVCSLEYERVRNVWKKRDAAFTLDLLKNVPPPSPVGGRALASNSPDFFESRSKVPCKILDTSSPPSESDIIAGGHAILDEFPCKVCGKIFSKVKSRSAHMKSHRPPEASESKKQAKENLLLTLPLAEIPNVKLTHHNPPKPT